MIRLVFKKINKAVMIVFLGLLLSGCVSHYGAVVFNSEPVGVQVYDLEDGSTIGVTPVRFLWRSRETRQKYMNVRIYKEGYKDVVKSFWLTLDHKSEEQASKNPQHVQIQLEKVSE